MANPDSHYPGVCEGEMQAIPAPAESGTRVKNEASVPDVYCSAGALSPEIDRILGSHLEGASASRSKLPSDDGQDRFIEPFQLLIIEDPDVEDFRQRVSSLAIPVDFLDSRIVPRLKALDYHRLLSQLVDLVVYYVMKQRGEEVFARPIALANQDFHKRALDSAVKIAAVPASCEKLVTLAEDLHSKLESTSK